MTLKCAQCTMCLAARPKLGLGLAGGPYGRTDLNWAF